MAEKKLFTFNAVRKAVIWKSMVAFAALIASSLLFAHHSASQYDFANGVDVEGKIILIEVSNPHIDLILEITNDDGSTKEVRFEGHSRNNVYRRGWRPDMMTEGDDITITIAPMRNGDDGGYIQDFKLSDGTFF